MVLFYLMVSKRYKTNSFRIVFFNQSKFITLLQTNQRISMNIEIPHKVVNNYQTIVFFTDIFEQTKHCYTENITIDFKANKVFESNVFAILGCLIFNLEKNKNKVTLLNIPESIQNLFHTKKLKSKKEIKQMLKMLIKCQRIEANETDLLAYMEQRIFPERTIAVHPQLKMAIQLCIAESFRNAFAHANCQEVFIAHYFSIHNKKLRITIVNKGKTIKQTTFAKYHSKNAVDAINWAIQPNKTSSTSEVHQGIGLPTIRQFIEQNEGKIKIVSGDAVWKQIKHRTFSKLQKNSFPGTIVTLEFVI